MKLVKKATAITIGLAVLNVAHASEWDQFVDQNVRVYSKKRNSGYIVRGGFGPAESIGPPKKIEWFKVNGNLETSSNNCGGLDFGAQFKAMFNKDALNQYLGEMKSLVSQVVAAAPMLLLQSVDPQMAEILKHLKAMANINMSTKMGQCKDLYKAMSNIGRQMFQPGKKNCVEKQLSAGVDIEQAMRHCNGHNELPDFLGQPVGMNEPLDVTKRISDKFNLSPNQSEILKGLMGETVLNASGIVQYKDYIRGKMDDKRKEYENEYKDSINKGLNSVRQNQEISNDLYEKMSTKTIPMSKEILLMLVKIKDEEKRKYLINTLSQTLANEKVGEKAVEDMKKAKAAIKSSIKKDKGGQEYANSKAVSMPGMNDSDTSKAENDVNKENKEKLEKSDRTRKDVHQVYKEIEVSFNKQVEEQKMYDLYMSEMLESRSAGVGVPLKYSDIYYKNQRIYEQMRGYGSFGGY